MEIFLGRCMDKSFSKLSPHCCLSRSSDENRSNNVKAYLSDPNLDMKSFPLSVKLHKVHRHWSLMLLLHFIASMKIDYPHSRTSRSHVDIEVPKLCTLHVECCRLMKVPEWIIEKFPLHDGERQPILKNIKSMNIPCQSFKNIFHACLILLIIKTDSRILGIFTFWHGIERKHGSKLNLTLF